jgi:glycosyltransferase involved in cell wall biosynthesis
MLSIIICSRCATTLAAVKRSIDETIGIPYEVIAIDNSERQYGICEAYNIGAQKSVYDLLCFMHEDIAFHTFGWGRLVAETLADEKIGVLGVAGGTYIANAPGSWNSCGTEYITMQVRHTVNGQSQLDRLVPEEGILFQVAAVDGVWMCCRKAIWQSSPFDAIVFPGFHFYDVDFCTRIFPTHQICVTVAVSIEHFSRGSYTKPWYEAALIYYSRRQLYLPFGSIKLSNAQNNKLRMYVLQQFILEYMEHGLQAPVALSLFVECMRTDLFNRDTYWIMRKWMQKNLFIKPKASH